MRKLESRSGRDLLHAFMDRSVTIDAKWLDGIIDGRVPEGQHIEYKAAEKLQKLTKRRDVGDLLRRYVFGFANADGGLLIIGIAEQDRESHTPRLELSPVDPNAAPTARQVGQHLESAAGLLHPPHRTERIEVTGGVVLVVGCLRSGTLLPATSKGQTTYYMRHADQTLAMEPWLLQDLMVGRRARPIIEVALQRVRGHSGSLDVHLEVRNAGLLDANSVHCRAFSATSGNTPLPGYLQAHIEMVGRTDRYGEQPLTQRPELLPALGHLHPPARVGLVGHGPNTTYCLGIVVTGTNIAPQWTELWVRWDSSSDNDVQWVAVPVFGRRCQVGLWHGLAAEGLPQNEPDPETWQQMSIR